ncbi:transcriptional coactivator Hfi1p/ADA1 [Diutina catenulata]
MAPSSTSPSAPSPAPETTAEAPSPIKKENGVVQVASTSATVTPSNGASNSSGAKSGKDKHKSTKRMELEQLMREFQQKLGSDWEKYHEALSYYLIGKLSRPELVETITPLLEKENLTHYHNKLLLLQIANSTKEGPLDFSGIDDFALFWNKKAVKPSKVKSTQYEKFKQNIMGLPIKERLRIKSIQRESGKQGKLNAGITLTRHNLLPKIPMIQDKDQQQLHVNSLVQWQQDVVNGINTPICTDNFELPDYENLSRRVLMTMREYGLTGGVNGPVLEVILLGLESYLKNIMEKAIDVAKYRENKYTNNDYIPPPGTSGPYGDTESRSVQASPTKRRKLEDPSVGSSKKDITLSIEDMYETLEMFPHLIEPCGAKYRLSGVMLENDDTSSQLLDYTLPDKMPVNVGRRDKDKPDDNKPSAPEATPAPAPPSDAHVGTSDDLKWVLHDLITTM